MFHYTFEMVSRNWHHHSILYKYWCFCSVFTIFKVVPLALIYFYLYASRFILSLFESASDELLTTFVIFSAVLHGIRETQTNEQWNYNKDVKWLKPTCPYWCPFTYWLFEFDTDCHSFTLPDFSLFTAFFVCFVMSLKGRTAWNDRTGKFAHSYSYWYRI